MTLEDANKIFECWKHYIEFHDKCFKFFMGSIPMSFLLFPTQAIKDALNIKAKYYFDMGDKKTSQDIQDSIGFLKCYKEDAEAVKDILFKLSKPELREGLLNDLKMAQEIWLRQKIEYFNLKESDFKG